MEDGKLFLHAVFLFSLLFFQNHHDQIQFKKEFICEAKITSHTVISWVSYIGVTVVFIVVMVSFHFRCSLVLTLCLALWS